jgi:MYXO-CTERM domain-containing protein
MTAETRWRPRPPPLVRAASLALAVICATGAAPASAQPWEQVLRYPPEVAAAVRARRDARSGLRDVHTTTVFLNFEGATIRKGQDSNAATDTTWIAFTHGACAFRESVDIPPFDERHWSGHGSRAQIIEAVATQLAELYAGYRIRFVTTRPERGHYTMTVIGGTCDAAATLCQQEGVVGVSPVDCAEDGTLNLNPDDINFVCSDSVGHANLDLKNLAYVIAHEVAHTFGLAHVDQDDDIMYFALDQSDHRHWGQGAIRVGSTSCSATGEQDDAAYLARALGGAAETPTRGCAVAPAGPAGLAAAGAAGVVLLLLRRRRS